MKPPSKTIIADEVLDHSNMKDFIDQMARELIALAEEMEKNADKNRDHR